MKLRTVMLSLSGAILPLNPRYPWLPLLPRWLRLPSQDRGGYGVGDGDERNRNVLLLRTGLVEVPGQGKCSRNRSYPRVGKGWSLMVLATVVSMLDISGRILFSFIAGALAVWIAGGGGYSLLGANNVRIAPKRASAASTSSARRSA